jgi:hypothetical protein
LKKRKKERKKRIQIKRNQNIHWSNKIAFLNGKDSKKREKRIDPFHLVKQKKKKD